MASKSKCATKNRVKHIGPSYKADAKQDRWRNLGRLIQVTSQCLRQDRQKTISGRPLCRQLNYQMLPRDQSPWISVACGLRKVRTSLTRRLSESNTHDAVRRERQRVEPYVRQKYHAGKCSSARTDVVAQVFRGQGSYVAARD